MIDYILKHFIEHNSNNTIRLSDHLNEIFDDIFILTFVFKCNENDSIKEENLKYIFKNRKLFFILFISTLFGLIHVYSPSYMLFAFFTVIPFIWVYIVLKDNNKSAFWVVCTAHMIRNAVVIIGVLNGMN